MKIALINPPSLYTYGKINSGHNCSFPLGLGYIAAFVREHGHIVRIFDPEPCEMPLDEMWTEIDKFQPDLIGITAVTSNFMLAKQIAVEAKKHTKYVIMGGPHVTALPKSTLLAVEGLDAVILREGELPVLTLANNYDIAGQINFNEVPGAAFFEENEYKETLSPSFLQNLDDLPYPARDLVDISLYKLHPQFARGKKSASILSSRGCPSACTFCANICTGRTFRANSPEYFVNELEYLVKEHGIKHFHIVDDCFTIKAKRVEDICDLIIKRNLGITWFIFGRANNLRNDALLKKMRQAGCIYILLGVESSSRELLRLMKKGTNPEMIRKCCDLLRKNDIKYFNSFILGNEGDTIETVKETVKFALELKSVMIGFNVLIPFPGTPLFDKYFKDYDKPDTNWDNWTSVGDEIPYEPRQTTLTRKDLLELTSWAYKKVYLNPGQLLRILRFVNNPHTFFNYARQALSLFSHIHSWSTLSRR